MKSATVFGAITDIYLSPSKAFNGLKDAKGWSWFALIFLVVFSSAAMYLFYTTADPAFLMEQQIAQLGNDLSKQDREASIGAMKSFADIQIWFAILMPILAIIIFNTIYALYFMMISKIDPHSDINFGNWFKFGLWTMMPGVINSLGSIILILTAKTDQLSLTLFNYASINQLILNLDISSPFYTLSESLGLFSIWGMILAMIGLKSWTNFTKNQAIVYGLLPYVIIFGAWFLVAAL